MRERTSGLICKGTKYFGRIQIFSTSIFFEYWKFLCFDGKPCEHYVLSNKNKA